MIETIILGIVQGITEFLPISSTAHLILLPWLFNWSGDVDTLTFDVALHAGTLLAVVICFWRDWLNFITNNQRIFMFIIIGSLPAGIAGFLLNDFVETRMREPLIIVFSLVIVGILMLIAEKALKFKEFEKIGLKEIIIIGISQAFAIIPGVSRSGITITAGLFLGIKRDASAKFSFLLSTPIIAGATLLHSYKAFSNPLNHDPELFLTGVVASGITGFIAIKFLMKFLKKYPLNIFVYYRFILAVVIIIGIWLKG